MLNGFFKFVLFLSVLFFAGVLHADTQADFIGGMVKKHGFDKAALEKLLQQAEVKASIIKAMDTPGEALPWYEYHPRFINRGRIEEGVKFWKKYAKTLRKAEKKYGVPAQIIVAIIGVETVYGKNTGNFRVLDALFTLSFHYPRRAGFFSAELEHYLLLCREQKIDPLSLKGSYAGAIGPGQFIPGSYRNYAVDFNNDGKRHLFNMIDSIGSIANYLAEFGWQKGKPVAYPVGIEKGKEERVLAVGVKPETRLEELKKAGLLFEGNLPDATKAGVFPLQNEKGMSYWMSLDNFYVITRYNHSYRYAMAVYLLSEEIKRSRETSNKSGQV